MITRIRYVRIKPNSIEAYKYLALDWQNLLHEYGGSVLGFYYNEKEETVVGIAEYESREELAAIQSRCESDPRFPSIRKQARELVVSFEEQVLDKLDLE